MVAKPGILLFALVLFCSGTIRSQIKIPGRVTDSGNRPLSFVSVVLLQDSNFVLGTAADEMGNFQLSFDFRPQKNYSIRLSLVGYRAFSKDFFYPDTGFIRQIVLHKERDVLSTVTVTARKPLIVRKADRYIINVENSFLADGNSGLEVLQKSPGIWVDNNGAIRIKGNQPVMVMINDIVQRMSGEELSEYLKTLKSEDISRIEVITNPSSEFEAAGSGGIIHIILKKARKDGLNGSVNGQYRQQGKKPYSSAGASMDYKVKNLYLFGAYTFTKDVKFIFEKAGITYPDQSHYYNHTDRDENTTRHQYRLGIAYDLAANQSISIQTVETVSKIRYAFTTGTNYQTSSRVTTGTTYADKLRNFSYNSTTVNYSRKIDSIGSTLKLIADYTVNSKAETNNFFELYSDPLQNSIYRNSNPTATDMYSIQADYTKLLKRKTEIKGGIKYASIKRDNTIARENYMGNNWLPDPVGSNRFIYTENLLMLYSSVEKAIKKTVVKAGLRAEETYSNGNSVTLNQRFSKKYFGLFPSFFLSQTLNEQRGNVIYLNYSRRLTRPTLGDLNPWRLQFNNYTALTGNPELLPQYTHNIGLGYKFLDKYLADVYVTKTTDVITLSANPGTNNFIEYLSQNLNNSTEYGFSFSAPFTIIKGWTTNNNFSFFNLSYFFNDVKIRQNSFSARTIHTIILKNSIDIDATADYRSSYVYSNLKNPALFYFDIGLSKRVVRNKGRLRLYFSDIFNTLREKEITDENNTHIEFYRKRPTRTVSFSFTYNFSSGKKFSNKKIDPASSEEKNRIGN